MSKWNFDKDDLKVIEMPQKIVEKYCNELSDLSDGKIVARVQEYKGSYKSERYIRKRKILTPFLENNEIDLPFNVQSVMGENASEGNNEFVYEMYITSKNTPNYKYRILIMYYGMLIYPVGITLQEDIAIELKEKSEDIKICDESSLMLLIEKIIGSNTIGVVLNNLAELNV